MSDLSQWAQRIGPVPDRAVLLCGGGVTSSVLTYWLHHRGTATTMVTCRFDQHGHGVAAAARTATALNIDHHLVDLSVLSTVTGAGPTMEPSRRLDPTVVDYLAHIAATVGRILSRAVPDLVLPVLVGGHQEDLDVLPCELVRTQPLFAKLSRPAIVQLGHDLGVRWADTRSCDRIALSTPCGDCSGCRYRRGSFTAADVIDPTDPRWDE